MRIKPKKSLGQNFLVDKNIQRKLVSAYALKKSDHVLEIGAGYGQLTKLIADIAAFVYAIEIDASLCRILKHNLREYRNVCIINEDILKFNLGKYFGKLKEKGRVKVIGNIPYYITTPIIEHLFKYRDKIETIFMVVQKEFSQRIAAGPGSKEYGSFSCFIEYYATARKIFVIKKNSFSPKPKVDSCLMEIRIRKAPAVKLKTNNEKLLFRIIRAAFNKRRKTLRNSLKSTIPPEKLLIFFNRYNIDANIRPESLSLENFANIANL